MTNLKCVRCGSANLVATDVCQACAIEMEPVTPPFARSTLFVEYQPRPAPNTQSAFANNTSIEPFDSVGSVLGPTIRLFLNNFWLITRLVVVIVAPFEVLKVLSVAEIEDDWQHTIGMFLLQLICQVLIAPALIFALMKVMQTGIAPGVTQCYRWGASKLGKLFIVALLMSMFQGLGYALCFVPGIFVSVALALVFPLAVLEKSSPMDVLRDSESLTRGHRMKILMAALVICAFWGLVTVPVTMAAESLAEFFGAIWLIPAAAIVSDIIWQALTVLSLITYLSIRRTLEGGHTQ